MSTIPDPTPINAPTSVAPPLFAGDPAPWFIAPSDASANFSFAAMGGRRVVLTFVDSMTSPGGKAVVDGLLAGAQRFVPFTTALLIVSADPADRGAKVSDDLASVRYLFDADRSVSTLYGVVRADGGFTNTSFIVDERLRILAVLTVDDAASHAATVLGHFDRYGPVPAPRRSRPQAPVLMIPDVFEAAFCKGLVEEYQRNGGEESGFMVQRDGMTVQMHDHQQKRRSDWSITDERVVRACNERIRRRVLPEIQRAFQFTATRIERHLVACYDAETGGHFAPHRDNTTKGTAHRRFAISINLNDDYEGGDLVFPEYERVHFRPPVGGACVFSCSMLHEAMRVRTGKRFVFVPFLYDEAGAKIRDANRAFLAAAMAPTEKVN